MLKTKLGEKFVSQISAKNLPYCVNKSDKPDNKIRLLILCLPQIDISFLSQFNEKKNVCLPKFF